jgi:predicted dehydrogenase
MEKINVGLIGLGGMGRVHFDCYSKSERAQLVALCDIEESKLSGDWGSVGLNLGDIGGAKADLSNVARTTDFHELISDPNVHLVDICLPTPLHAQVAIEALRHGKHVLCEKPMGFDVGQCWAMEEAVRESGKQLMIGHCLRYWPQYVRAHEVIRTGEFGDVIYANFHRSGGTPTWSYEDWLRRGDQSGGAVLDMHIHDVDTALWWFGKPARIEATGVTRAGLPLVVDSIWSYGNGLTLALHGSWDNHGGPFRYAFKVVMERASLLCDSTVDGAKLKLIQDGEVKDLETGEESAYQAEIEDFLDCLQNGRKLTRVTPDDGRLAVETVREEMRQISSHHH